MNIYYACFFFVFGLIMGSFYLVVADRLPVNESLLSPGSHCPYCKHKLLWYELIPILSYFLQHGKCRKCSKKLSVLYPIAEFSTGFLFLFSYLNFKISYEFFVSLILSSLLIIIFLTDFRYMIILDSPLILSTIFWFSITWYFKGVSFASIRIIEGLFSFLVMYGIGKLGDFLFKRESLGGGDIKLTFVTGMVLGFQECMISLVLATFLALPYALTSIVIKADSEVPFGPFLVASLYIVFLFYDKFEILLHFLFF